MTALRFQDMRGWIRLAYCGYIKHWHTRNNLLLERKMFKSVLLTASLALSSLSAQAFSFTATYFVSPGFNNADGYSVSVIANQYGEFNDVRTFGLTLQGSLIATPSESFEIKLQNGPNGFFGVWGSSGTLQDGALWLLSADPLKVARALESKTLYEYVQTGSTAFIQRSSFYLTSFQDTTNGVVPVTPLPAVPEPETYAMLLAGLGILGFVARRRKQIQKPKI